MCACFDLCFAVCFVRVCSIQHLLLNSREAVVTERLVHVLVPDAHKGLVVCVQSQCEARLVATRLPHTDRSEWDDLGTQWDEAQDVAKRSPVGITTESRHNDVATSPQLRVAEFSDIFEELTLVDRDEAHRGRAVESAV